MPKSSTEQDEPVDLAAELIGALERTAARVVDIEKRLAIAETDIRELQLGARNSLDAIQRGVAGMLEFMQQFQKPKQPPVSRSMN